ncbi:hypothetical protein BSU04_11120 [Caballeronia sordidicola]|uniref:Uncharacterized protein n=1 Tax=Caballeronia sordidicola TaxID=196367 RepID=A0A226X6G4_CABSO|nr:hypothetical protein BSU04_11120 [Caballeronia sordidicola]
MGKSRGGVSKDMVIVQMLRVTRRSRQIQTLGNWTETDGQ